MTATCKSRVKPEYIAHHTGKWQKFGSAKEKEKTQNNLNGNYYANEEKAEFDDPEDEPEEYEAWSCCMNQDINSAGCVKKLKDKYKWNYASFNNN